VSAKWQEVATICGQDCEWLSWALAVRSGLARLRLSCQTGKASLSQATASRQKPKAVLVLWPCCARRGERVESERASEPSFEWMAALRRPFRNLTAAVASPGLLNARVYLCR